MNLQPSRPAPGWQHTAYRIIFESDTRAGRAFDIGLLAAILLSVLTLLLPGRGVGGQVGQLKAVLNAGVVQQHALSAGKPATTRRASSARSAAWARSVVLQARHLLRFAELIGPPPAADNLAAGFDKAPGQCRWWRP